MRPLQPNRDHAPAAARAPKCVATLPASLSDKPAMDVRVEFMDAGAVSPEELDMVFSSLGQRIEELFR